MKTYTVQLTPDAEADLDAFFNRISAYSPVSAGRWIAGMRATIDSLDRLPERCGRAWESRVARRVIREIYHGRRRSRYRILFDIVGDRVRVLRVRHGRQRRLRSGEI